MEANTCLIDDFGPVPVVRPASVAELGEIVRRAIPENQAVYPLGGRTMLGYGLPPNQPGLGVDLRGMAEVIEYPARDMTITVQAGITLGRLRDVLRPENQRLPIDVPQADQTTLGGALAVNASGPRRYGHGTLRDYVIGISAVNDEGQEIKAGGRVVKNVAGYDMCKLFVGSLGTLGVISQVTLKLRPLPEEQALVALGCSASALGTVLDVLHASRTRPVCLDVLNQTAVRTVNPQLGGALPETTCVVLVGFEEKRETVSWQVQQLVKELPAGAVSSLEARVGLTADALWGALTEFSASPDTAFTFKANLLPSALAGFFEQATGLPDGLRLQAHAGNGIVIGHTDRTLTLDRARTMLTLLQATAAAAQGNVVLVRCPTSWKATLPVWGALRGDLGLMRAVRDKLDPKRRFNPGRFVV